MLAWHFTTDKLGDGRAIPPIGEVLRHGDGLELGASGLHASADPQDAFKFAPGRMLHRVRLGGEILRDTDKLCATQRTILATVDATDLLRAHARWCALQVTHLWDAPAVVREYLETGDEALREEAHELAYASYVLARTAAQAAARTAYAATYAEILEAAHAAAFMAAQAVAVDHLDYWRSEACVAARKAQRDDLNRRVAEAFAKFGLPED